MTTEPTLIKQEDREPEKQNHQGGGSGAVYGLGLIGAWVYFFKGVTTLKEGVAAFFKGLVWPAFLVYELFEFLKKD